VTPVVLLAVAFGGALLTYVAGKVSSKLRDISAVIVSVATTAIAAGLFNKVSEHILPFQFLGLPLLLRTNMLSWFFAIAIAAVGMLSIVFSLSYVKKREHADLYYFLMLLVNAGMLGIVLAGDLLTFYIFWEIMSWATFLLISYNRGNALAAGMKYIVMSLVGSAAYLIATLSILARCGTLTIADFGPALASAEPGYILFIMILGFVAFGIKNAVLPFHTWLPDAHSEAPSPFSAVLSGILVRMGMYGFILLFFVVFNAGQFLRLGEGVLRFHHIIAWIGAINIVIPTFIAMMQNDSKRLLAWHGVGQGGYMLLGVGLGTALGVNGGVFHIVNHTSYIALLFLVVGAVEHRTGGIRDLNSLGGLARRMPVAFIGALVGAAGLMGIPLTNGFVSKWLIYKSLILEGHPFLAFAALVGTWGTILSLYKFVHNIFLGQLPSKYENIKRAPPSMQLPILAYSVLIILFGILPGIPLKVINAFVSSFGFDSLDVNILGVGSQTGLLSTVNICAAVAAAIVVSWLVFTLGRRSPRVSQEDNYAAGSPIAKDKYHYTVEFFHPLNRMIGPYLKDVIDRFYYWLADRVRMLCDGIRRVYSGDVRDYVAYITLFLVLMAIPMWWQLW
jgi:formate hydrogenlyase subunit 3/multisubunit Na+/H+ antiporter MnhD subunit